MECLGQGRNTIGLCAYGEITLVQQLMKLAYYDIAFRQYLLQRCNSTVLLPYCTITFCDAIVLLAYCDIAFRQQLLQCSDTQSFGLESRGPLIQRVTQFGQTPVMFIQF